MRYLTLVLAGAFALCTQSTMLAQIEPYARGAEALPAERIVVDPDFTVTRLLSADRKNHGSWVVMTEDPKGRLIISAQHREGLLRITLNKDGSKVLCLEHMKEVPGKAQGLLFVGNDLYMARNESAKDQPPGLYRLQDTTGDDQFDNLTLLSTFHGSPGSEHGPHALVADPKGDGIFLVAGNHTHPPKPASSPFAVNAAEDRLLERIWDPRGHAAGIDHPGGWIARWDISAQSWRLVAAGFRNAYDMAFNSKGDLFAFDSDMEWDLGTPWYRPTSIYHVTEGAEYGWRSGTSKWSPDFLDACAPVVTLGEGSPTGVLMGTHSSFPSTHRNSLFVMDWTHGTIRRVELNSRGSTYGGIVHPFLKGRPLPLTDAIIRRSDGAMYFITGGRFTQSGLYRVAPKQAEQLSDRPATPTPTPTPEAEKLRKVEQLLRRGASPGDMGFIWQQLADPDRRIRYTARLCLEQLPLTIWKDRALKEKSPTRQLEALCALARAGSGASVATVVERLTARSLSEWPPRLHTNHIRIAELLCVRHPLSKTTATRLANYYRPHFPSTSLQLSHQIAQLLVHADAPWATPLILTELLAAPTQEAAIRYALFLKDMKKGWSPLLRRRYFTYLNEAARLEGGASLVGFIAAIRRKAIEQLPLNMRATFAAPPASKPAVVAKQSPAVPRSKKNWGRNDFLDLGWKPLAHRNFENGRRTYEAASCALCHRFNGIGIGRGPDLTDAGGRFSAADLLMHTLEPSREVSDQYRASNVFLKTGDILTGRIIEKTDEHLTVSTAPTDLSIVTQIATKDVEFIRKSRVSTMPQGLLTGLRREDILDLLAYLISQGEPEDPSFK